MKRIIAIAMLFAGCAHTPARIMTWAEYHQPPSWPYVLRFSTLLYYGARHTYEPADPQIAEIQTLWSAFHPDIALNEGGNPPFAPTIEESVTKYGEAGLLRFLARRDNIPVASLDPTRAEETAYLSKYFSRERVKMFFLVRGVAQQIQNHDPSKVDEELNRLLTLYNDTPGLSGSPHTAAEVQDLLHAFLPNAAGYASAKLSWFDPTKNETFFSDMSRTANAYRDRYMVEMLRRHLRDGERVFAVVGGTHVVMQEPALDPRAESVRPDRGTSLVRDRGGIDSAFPRALTRRRRGSGRRVPAPAETRSRRSRR